MKLHVKIGTIDRNPIVDYAISTIANICNKICSKKHILSIGIQNIAFFSIPNTYSIKIISSNLNYCKIFISLWLIKYSIYMERARPSKMEAKQLKNILISSRGETQTQKSIILQSGYTNEPSTFSGIKQNSKDYLEVSLVTMENQAHNRQSKILASSNIHKRLKLRDYIHLNDLQKRSKSKSVLKNNRSQKSISLISQQKLSATIKNQDKSENQRHMAKSILQQKQDEIQHARILKDQICIKIEEEINKLAQLQSYLTRDYRSKEESSETFVFLFNIYNKVIDVDKINSLIGEKIRNYNSKQDNLESIPDPNKNICKQYHWEVHDKKEDPHKMQMNFNLQQFLN